MIGCIYRRENGGVIRTTIYSIIHDKKCTKLCKIQYLSFPHIHINGEYEERINMEAGYP